MGNNTSDTGKSKFNDIDMEEYDLYELLGVRPNATNKEISRAYLKQAKKYHPDRLRAKRCSPNQILEGEIRMKVINEAYNILNNKESKLRYDGKLTRQFQDLRESSKSYMVNQYDQGGHGHGHGHGQDYMVNDYGYVNVDDYRYQYDDNPQMVNNRNSQMFNNERMTNDKFNERFMRGREEIQYQDPTQHGYGDYERTTSTGYNPDEFSTDRIFGKKFDKNEFNAIFEYYREQSEDYQKQMIKIEEPEPFYQDSKYSSEICSYNGLIVDKDKSEEGYDNNNGRYGDYNHAYGNRMRNPTIEAKKLPKNMILQQYNINNKDNYKPVTKSDMNKYNSNRNKLPNKMETAVEYDRRMKLKREKEKQQAMNVVNRYARYQFSDYMLTNANEGKLETSNERPESYLK